MNWDAIGAVGEILGAAAVFASLIYLALQIRIQNRESQLSAIHDISVGFRESIARFVTEETMEIAFRANTDYEALTDVERVRFLVTASQYFLAWEEAFVQHEIGRLPDRKWQSIQNFYVNGLGFPSMQRAWSLRRGLFDPDLADYVDSQVVAEYVTM